MINGVCAYELFCDGCKSRFESGDFNIFGDQDSMLEQAADYEWSVYRKDERHLCDGCRDDWGGQRCLIT